MTIRRKSSKIPKKTVKIQKTSIFPTKTAIYIKFVAATDFKFIHLHMPRSQYRNRKCLQLPPSMSVQGCQSHYQQPHLLVSFPWCSVASNHRDHTHKPTK